MDLQITYQKGGSQEFENKVTLNFDEQNRDFSIFKNIRWVGF